MPRITNSSDARKNCENGFLHLPKLDFHRFSLIFIEVLKIAENLEKQSFTFFAFLPPYIGVSGSLVSRMRKISMRSIDWYQKFLISCLAARYSTVYVFYMDGQSDFLPGPPSQVRLPPPAPGSPYGAALTMG